MPEVQEVQTDVATVLQVTLAHDEIAIHQARSGRSYELTSHKPCEMPLEDAYTFLVDPAFQVKDSRGKVIRPPSTKTVEGGRVMLENDEVIALLEELTKDALLKRCKAHNGSDFVKIATAKAEMMNFLIENASQDTVGQGRGSEGVAAEMSGSDLDGLIDLSGHIPN